MTYYLNEKSQVLKPTYFYCYRPLSPKAPPLPPGLGLLREPHMEDEPESAKSKTGKKSPADRKTPTRKTPTRTPTKTTPTKTPPPKNNPTKTPPPRKTPTPKGDRTPTLQAFPDEKSKEEKETKPESQDAGGRLSRGSKGSRGRLSQASKKGQGEIDAENDTRPFSQAHEEPLTQVEIETDETAEGTNQNKEEEKQDETRVKTPQDQSEPPKQ